TINYQYNGKGDRIVKDDPVAGITTYTYDSKSRMTGVITPDSAVTTLLYNAFDQLVEKQTPDGIWKYVYDGKVLLLETREDNATEVTYDSVLKDEYGELTSRYHDDTAGTDYYQYDGLGTTDTMSDEAEADLDTYVYRAFGQIESQTGTEENKFTFIGRQGYHHWPELELYFAGAGGGGQSAKAGQKLHAGRSLDPVAGRFASQDPIKDDEKNLYRYVGSLLLAPQGATEKAPAKMAPAQSKIHKRQRPAAYTTFALQ
ncbi:MAG: hypothetical protein K8T91_00785, partial [Planctomycetes bacterium]|nr:hypothetical protein [Planctomycetota bacterium]